MDHLSRIILDNACETPIFEFPYEQLFRAQMEPWGADIVSYLVTGDMPRQWTKDDRAHFLSMVRFFM